MSIIFSEWTKKINSIYGPKKYKSNCEITILEEEGTIETFCIDNGFAYKTFIKSLNPDFLEKCVMHTKYIPEKGKHVLHNLNHPSLCIYTYFENIGWYPTVIEFYYKNQLCKENGYIGRNLPSLTQLLYGKDEKSHYLSFRSHKVGLELLKVFIDPWNTEDIYEGFEGDYYCKYGNYFTSCVVYNNNDVLGNIRGLCKDSYLSTILRKKNIMSEIEISLFSAVWLWRRFFDNSVLTKIQFKTLFLCFNRFNQRSIILPLDIYFIIKDILRKSLWKEDEIPSFTNN